MGGNFEGIISDGKESRNSQCTQQSCVVTNNVVQLQLAPRAEQNLLLQYLTKLKSTLNCLYASVKRPKWVSTHEDHCAELNIANSNPISENTLPLISLSQYISINTINNQNTISTILMQQPTFPDLTNFCNNPWSTSLVQYCNGNLINSITIREILHHKKRGRILMRKVRSENTKDNSVKNTQSHNQSELVFGVLISINCLSVKREIQPSK